MAQYTPTHAAPQPEQPKRRRRWPWVVGGIVGVLLVGAVLDGGDDTTTTTPTTSEPAAAATKTDEQPKVTPTPEQLPGIGDEVRVGNLALTVTEVERVGEAVGGPYLEQRAQGVWWFIHLRATNHGDAPEPFSATEQYALVGDKRHRANPSAEIVAQSSDGFDYDELSLTEINPGNTVEGVLIFDLPDGVTPERVELHDLAHSDPAVVDLRK